jgi:hypothetical protein
MNLIDRYISAVAQQLPATGRDDITRELRANILDRLENLTEEQGRAATTADESAVLRELGHPQQVAASFLPPQTLVNTTWFPIFKQCLIYGLFAVFVVQLIGFCVATLSGSDIRITAIVSRLIHAALLMFAVVTVVFYALSNLPATAKISPYCNWKPEQLPPVQHPWQRIKLEDTVNEFASNLFFLLALQYSLWMSADTLAKLPVSINPTLQPWVLPLSIWAVFAIAFSLWNLRYNYWTQPKLWLSSAQNFSGCLLAAGLAREEILLINHRLPAPISTHINDILHWVLIVSACLFLYWALRSIYWLNLTRKIVEH